MLWRLWGQRELIVEMARREVVGRYRGSILGLFWSLLNPIFMLAVYTFVFSVVFRARWNLDAAPADSKLSFAVVLFAGLIVYNLFAEMITRAPSLVVGNVNYVKRVVFPLDILPLVAAGSALFHMLVSLLVLLVFQVAITASVPPTALFVPLVWAPFLLLVLGLTWALASLGVFLRDIAQPIGVLVTAFLFLSPILYPTSALPEGIRGVTYLNPLTFIIEQTRAVLLWGSPPAWGGLALYAVLGATSAWLGWLWFQKTRKGFADVL